MKKERIMQVLDIAVVTILFIGGCVVGKVIMERYDTWLSFNGPAIGLLVVGEIIWWFIRKKYI